MSTMVYLGAGSLAGGFARYFLTGAVHRLCGTSFPYGTLSVNLAGCFLIGVFSAAAAGFFSSAEGRMLWMTGFCGAFTTFSAFVLETGQLLGEGRFWAAGAYAASSLAAGLAVFMLGLFLGRAVLE